MNLAKHKWLLVSIIAVALPCLPLFCKSFVADFTNHTWMINYSARYFLHHLSFPSMFNTDAVVGMPFPMFYGYLFFPLMGVLSTVFDAYITIRFFAIVLFAAQFALVFRTMLRSTNDKLLALGAAAMVIWTIYPLTNLYHRAAVPEFFATGLLTVSFICWLEALRAETTNRMRLWVISTVLCLCTIAGTHPITCLYGLASFVIFQAVSLAFVPRRHKLKEMVVAAIIPVVLSVVCLVPWAKAVGKFSHLTNISYGFCFGHYDLTIDNLPLRLSPIPCPSRFLLKQMEIEKIGCRHVDAEANTPLLLVCLAALVRLARRRVVPVKQLVGAGVMLAVAAWLIYGSTFPGFDSLGHIARCIQFKYRLVTYINLAFLSAFLLLTYRAWPFLGQPGHVGDPGINGQLEHNPGAMYGAPTTSRILPTVNRPVLITALGLSFLGLVMKLCFTLYFYPIQPHIFSDQRSDKEILRLPTEFYGKVDYSIPTYVAPLPYETFGQPKHLWFQTLPGTRFGDVEPTVVKEKTDCLWTNVQEFPWNDFLLNGVPMNKRKWMARDGLFALMDVPAGTLSYRYEPQTAWAVLNKAHVWVYFLFIIFYGVAIARFFADEKRRRQGSLLSGHTQVECVSAVGTAGDVHTRQAETYRLEQ